MNTQQLSFLEIADQKQRTTDQEIVNVASVPKRIMDIGHVRERIIFQQGSAFDVIAEYVEEHSPCKNERTDCWEGFGMAQKVKESSLHPLAEVFGYKTTDRDASAKKHRKQTLCPYNNKLDVCTKDKKAKPLGVCSIYFNDTPTIICPIRFRENWRICSDSASFFFPKAKHWTPLKEIQLKEKSGKSAGNIDLIIAAHDEKGKIYNFGAVEVQAVYVSGNIRNPFEHYMKDPTPQ